MRKLNLFVISALVVCQFFLSTGVIAQGTFQKIYSFNNIDNFKTVEQTADSGFIVSGFAYDGFGTTNSFIAKTNKTGGITWHKNFGVSGNDEAIVARQLKDGGYILLSRFVVQGSGNSAFYGLTKLNSAGNTVWHKTFYNNGMAAVGNLFGDIQECADSSFIMAAYLTSVNGSHVHLLKLDASGDTTWTKKIAYQAQYAAIKLTICADGGYAILNHFRIAKTDAAGNLLWFTNYRDAGSLADLRNFKALPDNGFIVTGMADFGTSLISHVMLLKIDSMGIVEWAKAYQFFTSQTTNALDLVITPDGGYAMAGMTNTGVAGNTDATLIKTDTAGNVLWSRTYGGTGLDAFNSIDKTLDGGFILSGIAPGPSSSDAYLVKTDASGVSGCIELAQTVSTTNIVIYDTVFTVPMWPDSIILSTSALNTSIIFPSISTLCATTGLADDNTQHTKWASVLQTSPKVFTVKFDKPIKSCTLQLVDVSGKTIYTRHITEQSTTLDLSHFANGIYMLKATSNYGVLTQKVFSGM